MGEENGSKLENHLCKTLVYIVSSSINFIGSIIFFIIVILIKKSMNNIVEKAEKKMVSLYGADDEKS